ncbi:MAG: fibrobacter succinogenes major paralogous domain-containing protein [Fibromonadaceae bacterium]|jgi:uncharacterized protein (TIGR02145 family)|nr:fibrobacter succinogenes major paralogous domain-containing protein [Fibromonadaceae bacterium]
METKLDSKGKRFFAPAIAAGLMLAMAFTFNACGGDGGGGDDTPDSSSSSNGSLSSSSSGGGSLSSSSQPSLKCGEYKHEEKFCDERDEKLYKYVKINGQIWMAENLNRNVAGSRCYDDDEDNCEIYGRLYDWDAAINACPSGWHLSNNEEWDKLYRYADGTSDTDSPYESETAGKYLKSKEGWNWEGISGNGEDTYGFSALPGGYGNSGGDFYFNSVGIRSYWWSASEYDSDYAYIRGMYYDIEDASWNYRGKSYLYSVRCVKD